MDVGVLHTILFLTYSYSPVASVIMKGWENNMIQVCLAGRQKQEAGFFLLGTRVMTPKRGPCSEGGAP